METVIYGLNAAGTNYNKKLQTPLPIDLRYHLGELSGWRMPGGGGAYFRELESPHSASAAEQRMGGNLSCTASPNT
jgi:hypothetical protein